MSVNWQDDPPGSRRMAQLSAEEQREVESSKRMLAYVLIAEMIMLFSCAICTSRMWFRP